jgi:hypothetical protein
MKIEQLLRLIVIAIVILVAFSLLGYVLRFGSLLLGIGLKILVLLLIVAVILRFVEALRKRL